MGDCCLVYLGPVVIVLQTVFKKELETDRWVCFSTMTAFELAHLWPGRIPP